MALEMAARACVGVAKAFLGAARALEMAAPACLVIAKALEMAARARWASLGRSKSLLRLAQVCSASLERSNWQLEPARLHGGARNGSSSLLGFAGAREIAAQACLASMESSNSRSGPLGLAGALDLAARARSASRGRSTGQGLTKTNRTRQASGQACSETLRWAGPRMLVALNTETSILRALNARVRTRIVYICIGMLRLCYIHILILLLLSCCICCLGVHNMWQVTLRRLCLSFVFVCEFVYQVGASCWYRVGAGCTSI